MTSEPTPEELIRESMHDLLNPTIPHQTLPDLTKPHHTPPMPTTIKEQEEIKLRLKMEAQLTGDRPAISQIKTGLHDGLLYFGFVSSEGHTGVITSDKQVFFDFGKADNQIKNVFGLNYRYRFEGDILDSFFSISGIKRFLQGSEIVTLKNCYDRIKDSNQAFMYYDNNTSHKLIALDILKTYFLPIAEAAGRTVFIAERGSGKTRQSMVYKLLGCNSVASADISGPAFFRVMESTCVTLIIDDFDSLNEEQRIAVIQHYRTGYKRVSKAVRVSDQDRRLDAFRNYGHVVLNNTMGLDATSLDRSWQVPLRKSNERFLSKDLHESDPNWKSLRDDLYICALSCWEEVSKHYDSVTSRLRSRDFEKSRLLLALAQAIDPELKEEIERFLIDLKERNPSYDPEDPFFIAMLELSKMEKGQSKSFKEISDIALANLLNPSSRDYRKEKHGWDVRLGKKLHNFPGLRPKTIQGQPYLEVTDSKAIRGYIESLGGVGSGVVGCGGVEEGWQGSPSDATKENLEAMLIENGEMELTRLQELGFTTEQLDRYKTEGFIFEPRAGWVALI